MFNYLSILITIVNMIVSIVFAIQSFRDRKRQSFKFELVQQGRNPVLQEDLSKLQLVWTVETYIANPNEIESITFEKPLTGM